jgi:hypothetical protein
LFVEVKHSNKKRFEIFIDKNFLYGRILVMETTYKCPICQSNLNQFLGNALHPNDPKFGLRLECLNRKCTAQEVFGHGKDEKEAFKVISDKYKITPAYRSK